MVPPRQCPPDITCRKSCGCDGTSYCNECQAMQAGTFLRQEGECAGQECRRDKDCGRRAYCRFPEGQCPPKGRGKKRSSRGSAAKKRQPTLEIRTRRIEKATPASNEPSRLANTRKTLMNPANVMEISAVVSKKEKTSNSAA